MMKRTALLSFFFFFFFGISAIAQSTWPSQDWASAANLTAVMNSGGVTELSGLHWNPENKRLYAVQNDGRLRVIQYDVTTNSFASIANKSFDGGPEGITQVNFAANEFYTIDENNYEIRKYTHNGTFSTVTESRHWDLLQAPSPMEDTGNTGPEGLVFVPDSFLVSANFTSPETGQSYVSTKGMGGLMFVSHQDGGYIWVFDVNPNMNNDFAYVGKFRTSREESCDLAFDRTTGLLYILHNLDENYLEVTDMSLAPASGSEPAFTTVAEYFIANPASSNVNIEGFALMPKCGDLTPSAFLCRDASSGESLSIRQDVLRWFNPFVADGGCLLGADEATIPRLTVSPNPVKDRLSVSLDDLSLFEGELVVWDHLGREVLRERNFQGSVSIASLKQGVYVLALSLGGRVLRTKFSKE